MLTALYIRRPMASAETWYIFRHAVLREAAYQLLLPSARASLHESALELLETAGAEPLELADHAHRAREARGPTFTTRLERTERQHLFNAARQAERSHRIGDAQGLLRRLEAVAGADEAAQMEVARLRTRLTLMSGRGPEAVDAANRLLAAAQASGNEDLLARARFEAGRTFVDMADTARARELLELAAAHFRKAQSRELCQCLGSLSTAIWFSQSAELALPICDEALALALQSGDADAACGTSINRVNMLSGLRRVQEARVELQRARQLLPKAGPARAVMLEMTAGILEFYALHRDQAVHHYTRALNMAREFGMQSEVARALVNLASLDLPGVTPRVALERQAEAARIASECGDLRLALFALQGEAEALARIRDYETAAQRLQTARWYAQTLGQAAQAQIVQLGRAAMLISMPGRDGALQECLQALQECSPRLETALAWIATASALAIHYRQAGDANNARAWAARTFETAVGFAGIWQDAQRHLQPLHDLQPAAFRPPDTP